jgi:hypothetical protein
MSVRLAAEIFIGGDVLAAVVPELCRVITSEQSSLTWEEPTFAPKTAADLIKARQDAQAVLVLQLRRYATRWGEFEELEPALREHNIPYTRYTEGGGEFTAERVEFRPGMESPVCLLTDGNGAPMVPSSELVAVETALAKAVDRLDAREVVEARYLVRQALDALRKQLPPQLPPLTEFRIVP